MTLVIPEGFASAAWVFTTTKGTGPFVTTLGVDIRNYEGQLGAAASVLFAAYRDNLLPKSSSDLTLDRVTLSTTIDGVGGSVDSSDSPAQGAVTNSGFGPLSMALIARKVTEQLGRPGRGRMFLPGSARETYVDPDGSVTATERESWDMGLAGLMADLTTDIGAGFEMPPVILHSNPAVPPTPITGFVISDLVGWVRGRIR